MKGIGLVFSGGGGKGAYEIGVWKYLHETGLDKSICSISGTSVGALNAALFAGSNYETAEEIWLNMTSETVFSKRKDGFKKLVEYSSRLARSLGKITNPFGRIKDPFDGVFEYYDLMKIGVEQDYIFSREGIRKLISQVVNYSDLQRSKIPCFATCFNISQKRVESFKLNDYAPSVIDRILLASSAIPVLFENVEFKGEKYCDGGIPKRGDNTPIKPIYSSRTDELEYIIVVYLSRGNHVEKERYPGVKFIEISPSEDIGKFFDGTIDFKEGSAGRRINLGYENAKTVLSSFAEEFK
ncbi:NTE family protein [Lachnospiraceae bacterium YSD2013]|nr:NTE family protein [Lachnospiraceae bacterium YSD2013]